MPTTHFLTVCVLRLNMLGDWGPVIEIAVPCALKERGLGHVARLCSVEMLASIHMSGNYWPST